MRRRHMATVLVMSSMTAIHRYDTRGRYRATLDDWVTARIAEREPVLLENFFCNTELSRIDGVEQAIERIGDMALELKEEFVSWTLRHGGAADHREVVQSSVKEYLHLVRNRPDTALMCTEFSTPEALRQKLGNIVEVFDREEAAASYCFLGARGQCAHCHWDGDFRTVLLLQVFGHKRAVLLPPTATKNLLPVGNFAGVFFEHMSPEEQCAYAQFCGGRVCELNPGDTLLIPAAYWHYLEYLDTGMSINLRFAPSPAAKQFAGRIHAHPALQLLAWHFADHHQLTAEESQLLQDLDRLLSNPHIGRPTETAERIEICLEAFLSSGYGRWAEENFLAGNMPALRSALRTHDANRLYKSKHHLDLQLSLGGWYSNPPG